MRLSHRLCWLAVQALLIGQADAGDQASAPAGRKQTDAAAAPSRRRWQLAVSVGGMFGGDPDAFEKSFHAASLDQPLKNIFTNDSIPHPWSIDGSSGQLTVALGYSIRPWLEVRLQAHRSHELRWETNGYHGPFDDSFSNATFFSTAAQIRPLGGAIVAATFSALRVGVGASISDAQIHVYGGSAGNSSWQQTRPGLAVEVGLRLPPTTRCFLDASGQYVLNGSHEIGPYALGDEAGAFQSTFPVTSVSLNHTGFRIGLGVAW